jgi:hypothetical protein
MIGRLAAFCTLFLVGIALVANIADLRARIREDAEIIKFQSNTIRVLSGQVRILADRMGRDDSPAERRRK